MDKYKQRILRAVAFCPAHITGFFKAETDFCDNLESVGSIGAGFSIKEGVKTTVNIEKSQHGFVNIITKGYCSDKIDVSQFVINEFRKIRDFSNLSIEVIHEIAIPIGFGLGSSAAVALSLSYALDQALNTCLDHRAIGQIAHRAEVNCKTGLGDVLASFYGGFEIRVKPGAPGIGSLVKIYPQHLSILLICFSPISTEKFIRERLDQINGLGGKMVDKLRISKDYNHFQDLSLEFARYVKVMTPRMEKVIAELNDNGIKCGVALFGETIFTMIQKNKEEKVLDVFKNYPEGIVIKSELDNDGARILNN